MPSSFSACSNRIARMPPVAPVTPMTIRFGRGGEKRRIGSAGRGGTPDGEPEVCVLLANEMNG